MPPAVEVAHDAAPAGEPPAKRQRTSRDAAAARTVADVDSDEEGEMRLLGGEQPWTRRVRCAYLVASSRDGERASSPSPKPQAHAGRRDGRPWALCLRRQALWRRAPRQTPRRAQHLPSRVPAPGMAATCASETSPASPISFSEGSDPEWLLELILCAPFLLKRISTSEAREGQGGGGADPRGHPAAGRGGAGLPSPQWQGEPQGVRKLGAGGFRRPDVP